MAAARGGNEQELVQVAGVPGFGGAEPIRPADADELQRALLVGDPGVGPYFRLLARNAEVPTHRSVNDREIFYGRGGLIGAERELAATVTSRHNGCECRAPVHSCFTSALSKRPGDVQRLLDEGDGARIDERWVAVIDFVDAPAANPPRADRDHLKRLLELGFGAAQVRDPVLSAAALSWADRLMFTLGESESRPDPAIYRKSSREFIGNLPRVGIGSVSSRWLTVSEGTGNMSDRSATMANFLSSVLVRIILELSATTRSSDSVK